MQLTLEVRSYASHYVQGWLHWIRRKQFGKLSRFDRASYFAQPRENSVGPGPCSDTKLGVQFAANLVMIASE